MRAISPSRSSSWSTGEIDAGGKSLGRFQPSEETEKKNALIAEIIAHFNF
jgi:hypothetical protein